MADITPITRLEEFIVDAKEGTTPTQNAITRVEMFLAKIAGANVVTPSPITRIETFLASIAGETVTLPKPLTRVETFLAAIAGEDVETPTPITRVEIFLAEWAEGGGGSVVKTITGEAPITFDALAAALVSLTQNGKTVQDGTPTTDAPVDIVCNNGTLKMRHRSGLPSGYKLLEYIGGSGSQYVITGVYLASTDVIECEFKNSTTTGYGAIYGIFKLGESSALYANQNYYGYDQSNNKVDTGMSVDTDWHSARHDFVNGTLTIDDTTVSFTPWSFTNTTKNAVLSRFYNGSYGYNWKGYVRKFKVMRGNEVICDLLPAKNSNDVAGLYDLIRGNFYTATGGTLLEGDVVDDYELTVDGTPEVLTLGTQTASVADLYAVNDYKDTQEIIGGTVKRNVGIKVLDGTESGWALSDSGGTHRFRGVKPSDCHTPASRAPSVCTHFKYVSTGSAVGGMFIGASQYWYFIPTDQTIDTVDEWTAWLAAQYANGTPVIVLYPLAEETTESVQGQRLHSASGENTISVTSNVDPVNLTVEYKAEPEGVDEP